MKANLLYLYCYFYDRSVKCIEIIESFCLLSIKKSSFFFFFIAQCHCEKQTFQKTVHFDCQSESRFGVTVSYDVLETRNGKSYRKIQRMKRVTIWSFSALAFYSRRFSFRATKHRMYVFGPIVRNKYNVLFYQWALVVFMFSLSYDWVEFFMNNVLVLCSACLIG